MAGRAVNLRMQLGLSLEERTSEPVLEPQARKHLRDLLAEMLLRAAVPDDVGHQREERSDEVDR